MLHLLPLLAALGPVDARAEQSILFDPVPTAPTGILEFDPGDSTWVLYVEAPDDWPCDWIGHRFPATDVPENMRKGFAIGGALFVRDDGNVRAIEIVDASGSHRLTWTAAAAFATLDLDPEPPAPPRAPDPPAYTDDEARNCCSCGADRCWTCCPDGYNPDCSCTEIRDPRTGEVTHRDRCSCEENRVREAVRTTGYTFAEQARARAD